MKPKFNSRFASLSTVIFAGAIASSSYLRAAPYNWTGATNGTWNTTTNWSGSLVPTPADDLTILGPSNVAGALTINFDADNAANSLTFTNTAATSITNTTSGANRLLSLGGNITTGTGAVTIGSATANQAVNIALAGAAAWSVGSGGLTVNNVISGSGGLTKSGSGTLTLLGANVFTGGTSITGGVLSVGASGNSAAIAAIAGGSIALSGGGQLKVTSNNLSSSSQVTIGTGGGSIAVNGNNNFTTSGKLTGSGTLTKAFVSGAGNQTLNFNATNNDFTGAVVIDNSNTSGITNVVTFSSLVDTGTAGAGNITFSRGSSGSSNGQFTFNATATSGLTLTNRQFVLNTGTSTSAMTVTILNNSTTQAVTINSDLAASGSATKTLVLSTAATGATNVFDGDISNGTGGAVTVSKTGAGIWTLSGNNGHSGGTNLSAGTLNINSATALGTGTFTIGAATFNNTSGAAITNSNNNAIAWNGDATFTGTNNLDLGTGAVTMGGNRAITVGGTLTMGGIVSDGASDFNITKGGGGTLVLSGLNSYSGRTTVNQGVLSINSIGNVGGGNSALGNPATLTLGTVNLGATTTGGTLRYTGTGTVSTDRVINLSGTTGGAGLDMSGTGTLTFTSNLTATGGGIKTLTLTGSTVGIGVIEGAIVNNSGTNTTALAKTGSGTWTLSGPNTYSGGTTIGTNAQNVGTLNITHSSALGTGAVSMISNSGTGNFATLTLNSATGITVANNFSTSGEGQGGNGIIRNITGDNVISGTITLMGGGGSTRIHSDGGSLTLSGAIAPNTTLRFLLLGGSATGEITGNINNGSGANTLSGLTKEGGGTWTLSGTNGYSGPTTVSAGTLKVSGGAAIPNAGLVSIANAAGATFQVAGSETIGALSGGGATGGDVSIDSSQTLSLSSGTQTYAGTVSGSGALTNSGAIQTLNGALSHTGGVNVSGGVLTLGSSSNTYTGVTAGTAGGASILVTADGALGATGAGNETTVFGAGTGNGSQLGFSGGINYTGAEKVVGSGAGSTTNALGAFTTGNRGFIQSVSGNNTFAGDIELSANGVSRIGTQDGARLTLTGAITQGTGITTASILFRSGNTNGDFVTISNTGNSFGGNSTVFSSLATPGQYAGLRLGADNAHPTNLTVQNFSSSSGSSTSFDLNGNDQTLNGLASGGTGTLNIINLDTVNASTLTLNPTADRTNAATMTILGGSPGGTPLGVINVVKDGSFKQTLVGNHTYTGTTLVSAGTLFVTGSLTSNVTVSDTATVGGGGTVGDISFGGGSFLDIALAVGVVPDSLTTGAISFAATGFGVDNLVFNGAAVDWSTVTNGTYTLLTGTLNSLNLDNFGLVNAYDLGGGRSAYFQEGSLQLVVIPEPNVAALIGAFGGILLLRRRR